VTSSPFVLATTPPTGTISLSDPHDWDKPEAGKKEQIAIMIPFSKARADAVEAALMERGLEKARFTTEGVGAADQLVPDSDFKNRWQNRRVALFLDRR